ncbi:MAG TPA: hypothetical protein VKK79_17045 [Candidatus Lokiarchaeia archaeon]|nr:hypothetical protein [Candidatus Lokiarchaeia archaeon]
MAIDHPLSKSERKALSTISRRARITPRVTTFFYGGESDMSTAWETLMNDYFDVMYSESYGWGIFAFALDNSEKQFKTLKTYEFDGNEDCGIRIERSGPRTLISVHCQLDFDDIMEDNSGRDYVDEEEEDEENEDEENEDEEDEEKDDDGRNENEEKTTVSTFEPSDPILRILTEIRAQIIAQDYRALYAVWETYCSADDNDEEDDGENPITWPQKPQDLPTGNNTIDRFRKLMSKDF